MRTLTIKSGGSGTNYSAGWHELLVSKAEYGEWNGSKYLDVYFDEYPENLNMRVMLKLELMVKNLLLDKFIDLLMLV